MSNKSEEPSTRPHQSTCMQWGASGRCGAPGGAPVVIIGLSGGLAANFLPIARKLAGCLLLLARPAVAAAESRRVCSSRTPVVEVLLTPIAAPRGHLPHCARRIWQAAACPPPIALVDQGTRPRALQTTQELVQQIHRPPVRMRTAFGSAASPP